MDKGVDLAVYNRSNGTPAAGGCAASGIHHSEGISQLFACRNLFVKRQGHIAVGTSDHPTTGTACHKPGIAAAVQKQHRLTAPLKAYLKLLLQMAA